MKQKPLLSDKVHISLNRCSQLDIDIIRFISLVSYYRFDVLPIVVFLPPCCFHVAPLPSISFFPHRGRELILSPNRIISFEMMRKWHSLVL